MKTQVGNLTARWIVLAGIAIAAGALALGALRHEIADYWSASANPENWLRAAEYEPANPENWYRLGRYHQLDFEHADLPLAISYYQRAVAINPASPYYWADLADAYEAAGKPAEAEKSFRAAQRADPNSPDVAWRFGNFLMRQNRVEEAFQQIHRAVSVNPGLAALAVSVCWRSTKDIDRILDLALPATAAVHWGALDFFVKAREPAAAMAVWSHIVADAAPFSLPRAFPALDMLTEARRAGDARTVWQQALSAAKIAPQYEPAGSLIWNGGFEHDLLNGGLAWRYLALAGAEVDFDGQTAHSGERSLRVAFSGTANLDFDNFWQDIVAEPNTRYRFSAYVRTEDITTDSGMRFEIRDLTQPAGPQFTANTAGTQPWTLEDVEIPAGPTARLLRITLRRTTSDKLFNNKIRGTVWVDDVSLLPVSPAGERR